MRISFCAMRGREREDAVFRWIRFHGIAGVHDQVEEDLLELHAIRHGRRKVGGGEVRDGDAARDEIAAGEAQQFFETLVHVHRLELDLATAQHGAQALDDLSGAAIRADDVREDGANLDEVGRVLRDMKRSPACALIRMLASGWLSSCAREPESALSVATRERCASSSRCSCASAPACFWRVMSIATPRIRVGAPLRRGWRCGRVRQIHRTEPSGRMTRNSDS